MLSMALRDEGLGSIAIAIHQFPTFVVRNINQSDVLAAYFSQGFKLCNFQNQHTVN